LAIEDKFEDDIQKLMDQGKEKGYLTYGEVNDLLPDNMHSADDLDDLITTINTQGIDLLEGEPKFAGAEKFDAEHAEEGDDVELDLTPGTLEKTNDPVRMYLREMGTVPLLTREGEVEIAKRIERGQLRVLKAISRSPIVIREVIALGEDLKRGVRNIKEVVIFDEEEITEEILQTRVKATVARVDALLKHQKKAQTLLEKLETINPKSKAREHRKTRQVPLHRWMYENHTGQKLCKGQNVRQTCGNKLCLAPAHLATSTPRQNRTPLGDAGQYKGKPQRTDYLEECTNGHPWTEETLYTDPAGRRSCRRCSANSRQRGHGNDPTRHEWRPRKSWEEKPECANGHLYNEVGWYFNGEARVCRQCFAEKERKRWLRVNYGMALEDFEALLIAQGFRCAICGMAFSPDDRGLTPCVDHFHAEGRVRGLLCHACNLGIGHFCDDVDRLRSAIEYLRRAVSA